MAGKSLVIEIQLGSLLKKKGQTLYWLGKESGVSYKTLMRLNSGRAEAIQFDTLIKICTALNCLPGDILVMSEAKRKPAN